jgi:hypothetical protein
MILQITQKIYRLKFIDYYSLNILIVVYHYITIQEYSFAYFFSRVRLSSSHDVGKCNTERKKMMMNVISPNTLSVSIIKGQQ